MMGAAADGGTWSKAVQAWGIAGCSNAIGATATNPIDIVKLRMQLGGGAFGGGRGAVRGAVELLRTEGPSAFARGLPASWLREMVYAGLRLGCYDFAKENVEAALGVRGTLAGKVAAGALSGAFGSAVGSPTELLKVRIQSQTSSSGLLRTAAEITREGGAVGWFRGAIPFVQRSSALTAAQVASYDHTKQLLIASGAVVEGSGAHLLSSMVAGFAAAAVSTPFDFAKSRLMSGRPEYQGITSTECLRRAVVSGGLLAPYRGFVPNWLRIGPHTVVTFLVYERLRAMVGFAPV